MGKIYGENYAVLAAWPSCPGLAALAELPRRSSHGHTGYFNISIYGKNLWGKLMGKIYGENLRGKLMGKINGEKLWGKLCCTSGPV